MAVALIVAAGRGERLGSGTKALVTSRVGRCSTGALRRSVRRTRSSRSWSRCPRTSSKRPRRDACGRWWRSRSQSVRAALAAAGDDVRARARRGAAAGVARAVCARARRTPAQRRRCVIAAAPVADTIKQAGATARVERTLDRSRLWAVQTPQVFRREALAQALIRPRRGSARPATDDAWLIERGGGSVPRCPMPDRENVKVTTATGPARSRSCCSSRMGGRGAAMSVRTGIGYDCHAFAEGRPARSSAVWKSPIPRGSSAIPTPTC